jgi:phage-related protein
MPGSVQNCAPAAVLPQSLSRAFVHTREYPAIENDYRNGESQRSVEASTSRKRWRLAKRLTPAQLQALRSFYEARNGPAEPFYFYDPYETTPKFSYDPAGQASQGRYAVRFNCEWSQSVSPGRAEVEIELLEVA